MNRDLAITALKMAIALRSPPRGCIFHSDCGSQYCSVDYKALLRKRGILISMSGKGNCHNSTVESSFNLLKRERIRRRTYRTREEAR